jgi:hypothetical protein
MDNALIHFSKMQMVTTWVVVAADRLSNNGTAYIDFEFLQNTLDITGSPVRPYQKDQMAVETVTI